MTPRIYQKVKEMTDLKTVANQVGVSEEALRSRIDVVIGEQSLAWKQANLNEADIQTKAIRIAARQLTSERARIAKSGCERFDGMFVSVPPKKDWAHMAYRKMTATLQNGSVDIEALVSNGEIIFYRKTDDGYLRLYNSNLEKKRAFASDLSEENYDSLPKRSVELDNGDAFSLVWNKTNHQLPSGDSNWQYGIARPLEDSERTCKFLGMGKGDSELTLFTVRFRGEEASRGPPSFEPGYIALKRGKNENCYSKAGVSTFTPDSEAASMFPGPPLAIGDSGPEGIIPELVSEFLGGLSDLRDYYTTHREDDDWWGQSVATVVEVVHIDPRERGGWSITVGDLDIMSDAPTIDIWLPKGDLSFGVGSSMCVMGAPWITKEDEVRFSVYGWWICDNISPVASNEDAEGWD